MAPPVAVMPLAPEPDVTPKAYTLETTAEGLRVTLSSLVLFDVNKYDLKDSAKEGLDQVAELLKAYPTNALRISGYTDSTGGQAHNQALSESRAKAVADWPAAEVEPERPGPRRETKK